MRHELLREPILIHEHLGAENERRGDKEGRRREKDSKEGEGTKSLLVKNLSFEVRSDDLRKLFEKYGEVRDIYIPLDYNSKRPRGFAFVEFINPADARFDNNCEHECVMFYFLASGMLLIGATEKSYWVGRSPLRQRRRGAKLPRK